MVRAIVEHPGLELVGLYAHSEDKAGQDAGPICALPPTGVVATRDAEALLALKADCVSYNPRWPDVDELCRILETGANVVTTAGFLSGHALGAEAVARLEEACRRGGSSIYGSGMNPGFASLLGLVASVGCARVERVRVLESVDASGYASEETQRSVGFGHPVTHPDLHGMVERGSAVFQDALHVMADALDVELEATRCESEFAVATRDIDLGFMRIDEGCVAGVAASWHGLVGGETLIELRVQWIMGSPMEPAWKLEHGYVVNVEGTPNVHAKLQVFPPRGFVAETPRDFMRLGMILTGMPAIHAIPAVCAAAPGIVRMGDLPLRACVGSARRA
jgi:hypothetical protein